MEIAGIQFLNCVYAAKQNKDGEKGEVPVKPSSPCGTHS